MGRSAKRCRQAEKRLRSLNSGSDPTYLVADLALQSQVRELAEQIRQLVTSRGTPHLGGLVNTVGVFTYWLSLTAEGFETQWAVNRLLQSAGSLLPPALVAALISSRWKSARQRRAIRLQGAIA